MTEDAPTIGSLWHAVRRRWFMVAIPLVLVPAGVIGLSARETPKYRADAQVLLQRHDLASALLGTAGAFGDDQRYVETQARVAVSPAIARRTLRAAGTPQRSLTQFLDALEVRPSTTSDIVDVSVTDTDRTLATVLATTHAREWVAYLDESETAAIRRAQRQLTSRLRDLEQRGQRSSAVYRSLADKVEQLAAIDALRTARASVINPARSAVRTSPRIVRNAAVAVLVGIALGLAAAFVLEALDTRVRRSEEVARKLETELLGHLPAPPRSIRRAGRLAMLSSPLSSQSEAFRLLRTNLELVALGSETRVIAVTSAREGEGKTTTAANLAVAFAHSGRDVALVDLDLRRPGIQRAFNLRPSHGVSGATLGKLALEDVLIHVDVQLPPGSDARHEAGGSLRILPAGIPPPNPGELVGSIAVQKIVARLAAEADLVLIDTPPLLSVGDAMVISSFVDGVLLVLRVSELRRAQLAELSRLTQRMPAQLFGLIVTGEAGEDVGYGYYADIRAGSRVT